jgi:hypothetical protein
MLPDLMRPSELPALVLTIAIGVALMISADLTIQRLTSSRSGTGRLQGANR